MSKYFTSYTLFCLILIGLNSQGSTEIMQTNSPASQEDLNDERKLLKNEVLNLSWHEKDFNEVCTSFLGNFSSGGQKKDIQLITAYHCSLHQHLSKGRFELYYGGVSNEFEKKPSTFNGNINVHFPKSSTYPSYDLMFSQAPTELLSQSKIYEITKTDPRINDSLTLIGYSREAGGPYSLSCRYHGKTVQYAKQMETFGPCHSNSISEFRQCKVSLDDNRGQNSLTDPHEMGPTNLPDSLYDVMLCEQKITKIIDDPVYKGKTIVQGIKSLSSLGGLSGGPVLTASNEVAGVFSAGLGLLDTDGTTKLILIYKPLNKKMLTHDISSPLNGYGEIFLDIDNFMLVTNGKVLSNATTRLHINNEGFLKDDYEVTHPFLKKKLRFNRKSELISE